MKTFVAIDSVVRQIWGKADTILFIFAGAAAEFSLNKAVDWLYFTGKLPADPIGRLFSTVAYARQIIFAEEAQALAAIDRMRMIHSGVEQNRGFAIPDEAYRDVLFMLIHYSVAAFELLEHKLEPSEKEEIVAVFCNVGRRMGIPGLPETYGAWQQMHREQLGHNLQRSAFTTDLYRQYKKHLGSIRYAILVSVQSRIAPPEVLNHLGWTPSRLLPVMISGYHIARRLGLETLLKTLLLPAAYYNQVRALDNKTANP